MQDLEHEKLLQEVSSLFSQGGWQVYSATYHDVLNPQQADVLRRLQDDVTAQYLRTRSDRAAFHPQHGAVEFDAKTNLRGRDATVEAIPFLAHVIKWRALGVRTFFAYRWPTQEDLPDRAIWANDASCKLIDRVFLSDREDRQTINRSVERAFKVIAPHAHVSIMRGGRGSGDPMLRIPESATTALPGWRETIAALASPN